MGQIFQQALRQAKDRQSLLQSQRLWLTQRDSSCTVVADTEVWSCLLEMTKSRASTLAKTAVPLIEAAPATQPPSAVAIPTTSQAFAQSTLNEPTGKSNPSASLASKNDSLTSASQADSSFVFLILIVIFLFGLPITLKVVSADAIEEVRIEGHTSALWKNLAPDLAYYENMKLSQERARSVLIHVFGIPLIRDDYDQVRWILARVTANGLSSARRLLLPDGGEDFVGSQRVEFRVRTTAEDQLSKILGALSR